MSERRPSSSGAVLRSAGARLDASPLALMLDVDGTLAPISATPDAAAVPDATRTALRALAGLPGVSLAFVSGRGAADAARLVGLDGVWYAGNHGFELRDPSGQVDVDPRVKPFLAPVAEAVRVLAPLQRSTPGVIVEDKGATMSLHYRKADPAAVAALIARARDVAEGAGLRVTEGKKIVELRPPVAIDKGTVVLALAERLGALADGGNVFYAGDDRTDEDAFRALRQAMPRAVTVRVAAPGDTEAQHASVAEYLVASTEDVRRLLELLAARRAPRAELP